MTEPQAALYAGEPAPRRRWVAIACTVLMPGLGHVYAGAFAGGLLRYLTCFFGGLLALLLWRAFLFQPHLPLAVLGLTYLVYLGALIVDVRRRTGPGHEDYTLQGFNHPVVYVALLVCCHLAPTGLLVDRLATSVVGATLVEDGGMFPMLFMGDRVLLDRTAYRARPPQRGDLAALRRPGTEEILIRRVVAGPRDTLTFEGRTPAVNALPLPRRSLGDLSLPGVDNRGLPRNVHLVGWQENNGDRSYIVTHHPTHARATPGPTVMPQGRWYVMADNRDGGGPDSRDFGPLPWEAFLGRPLYVWWSRRPNPQQVTAWSRIGLAAR